MWAFLLRPCAGRLHSTRSLPPLTSPHRAVCLQACLLAACPGAWPRLRRLAVADARDVPRIPSLPSLASLAGLSSLRFYQRDGFTLPGPLTALRRLAHLHAAASLRRCRWRAVQTPRLL